MTKQLSAIDGEPAGDLIGGGEDKIDVGRVGWMIVWMIVGGFGSQGGEGGP